MKKCLARLTDEERKLSDETIDKLVGSSQKSRRARVLRQVDADGPGWTDRQVAALGTADSISHETARKTLKKTAPVAARFRTG